MAETRNSLNDLVTIMTRLRDPQGGCEWDLAQTFASIAPYTIEEAYEVADAIARGSMPELKDELGDLLLQVVFHARMAEEAGAFAIEDVIEAICDKMVRRHPHIFDQGSPNETHAIEQRWEEIKAAERGDVGVLDGVALALPALLRAQKIQKRAARVGFDWPDASGAFTTPQSIKDAPPANAFRRALRQTASVEFYGGSRPLRHCLCVIDARDGRDAAVQAHERLAQILDDSICVCALVCAVDRPEWADAVIKLERRHSRLVTRLIWVQRGANAQKAVATWARTYMRRFDRTRGKNNDDPLEFLHGQCVDDVKRWKRARPTKHVDAWAPALNTLLPDAAAEAVAAAFPSYSRLVEALRTDAFRRAGSND